MWHYIYGINYEIQTQKKLLILYDNNLFISKLVLTVYYLLTKMTI